MKYKIRRIPISFKLNEIITFKAQSLCKILTIELWKKESVVIVLERWGQVPGKEIEHKMLVMSENHEMDYTVPYEPVFSLRDIVKINGNNYYVFKV